MTERQPHHRGAQVQWRKPARTLAQERHLRSQLWAGALECGPDVVTLGKGPGAAPRGSSHPGAPWFPLREEGLPRGREQSLPTVTEPVRGRARLKPGYV